MQAANEGACAEVTLHVPELQPLWVPLHAHAFLLLIGKSRWFDLLAEAIDPHVRTRGSESGDARGAVVWESAGALLGGAGIVPPSFRSAP